MGPDNKWCPWCDRQDPPARGKYDGTMTDWLEEVQIVTGCVAKHPERQGGQHVAKTCTAVLAIHQPTGICVRWDAERSQYSNREAALDKLRRILHIMDTNPQ